MAVTVSPFVGTVAVLAVPNAVLAVTAVVRLRRDGLASATLLAVSGVLWLPLAVLVLALVRSVSLWYAVPAFVVAAAALVPVWVEVPAQRRRRAEVAAQRERGPRTGL